MQTKVHKALSPTTSIPVKPLQFKWKEPYNKVYVVAGNHTEMESYRRKKIEQGSTDDYYYVHSPESLRGLSTIKGVFIGTWAKRNDIHLIKAEINHIKARMVQDEAMSKAAGFLAQEIDQEVIGSFMTKAPNTGLTATQTLAINSLNTGISSVTGSSQPYLTEAAIRDMMKKYIDEALKNPNTLGGI